MNHLKIKLIQHKQQINYKQTNKNHPQSLSYDTIIIKNILDLFLLYLDQQIHNFINSPNIKMVSKKDTPSSSSPTLYQNQPHLQRKPFMGKHQQTFTLIVMLICYQLPLFFSVVIFAYSVLYMQYYIWILFALIIIAQYPIGRSQRYIDAVNKYINPLLYFKRFKRIYEQRIPDDKQNCLFGFHPHGVLAYGLLANMNYQKHDALSRMVGLGSRFILNMPITGLLLRLWGVQAVDPSNLKRLMQKGQNVGLLPGGFEQATLTTSKQMRIFIQSRKGFIKYALKYNYTIYPTIILKQHQAFWTFDKFLKFRMWLNKVKLPGVVFFHPKSLFFYPPECEFITVVGKGLKWKEYKVQEQPTLQQIEDMHKVYIKQLKRIYDKYKSLNDNKPLVMY